MKKTPLSTEEMLIAIYGAVFDEKGQNRIAILTEDSDFLTSNVADIAISIANIDSTQQKILRVQAHHDQQFSGIRDDTDRICEKLDEQNKKVQKHEVRIARLELAATRSAGR